MRTPITNFILFLFRIPAVLSLALYVLVAYSFMVFKSKNKNEIKDNVFDSVQHFFHSYEMEANVFCFFYMDFSGKTAMSFFAKTYLWIMCAWIYLQDSIDTAKSMYRHPCEECNKKYYWIPDNKSMAERKHVCPKCFDKKYPYTFICLICDNKFYTNQKGNGSARLCDGCTEDCNNI